MAKRKDKISVTGQPLLFERMAPTADDGQTFDRIFSEVKQYRGTEIKTGIYFPIIPDELLDTAKNYYLEHVGQLRELLTGENVPAECIAVTVEDYAAALCGCFNFRATIKQIPEILNKVAAVQIFTIDRYGLYCGLFLNYANCLTIYGYYLAEWKDGTEETRQKFKDRISNDATAAALYWLAYNALLKGCDTSTDQLSETIATATGSAVPGFHYCQFTFIAAKAYAAAEGGNTEQFAQKLAKIRPPLAFLFGGNCDDAIKRAVSYATETDEKFQRYANNIKTITGWEQNRGLDIFVMHGPANLLLSRPIEWTPNKELTDGIPLIKYIDDWLQRDGRGTRYGQISPFLVQRVFGTLDIWPNLGHCTTTADGITVIRTTKNDFAEAAGLSDANNEQQNAYIGALALISDQYFIINRPLRVDRDAKTGKPVGRMHGGRTATRLVNVDFEQTGDIIIKIFPEYYKGDRQVIRREQLAEFIKRGSKRLAKDRFYRQLMAKGHKNIEDLADEVFGYSNDLKLAKDDAEAIKRVKNNIRCHKDRDRKDLLKWFEEYKSLGIIEYTTTKKSGKITAVSWQRLDVPDYGELPPVEVPQLTAPEPPEETQAEPITE